MIVEGLGTVSFVNGLLRIQTMKINANGKEEQSGEIIIPGNRVGAILTGLSQSASGIDEKLKSNLEVSDSKTKEKSSKKNKKK